MLRAQWHTAEAEQQRPPVAGRIAAVAVPVGPLILTTAGHADSRRTWLGTKSIKALQGMLESEGWSGLCPRALNSACSYQFFSSDKGAKRCSVIRSVPIPVCYAVK